MRIRSAIILSTVSAMLLGLAGPARANHFDGNAGNGTFNPVFTFTPTSSLVNRVHPVRIRFTQADHEDPPIYFGVKFPEFQFPFSQLKQAANSALVPTTNCEDAIDGYHNSPDNTGIGTNVDFSKRTDAKIVRAEKIGTGHLEVHADTVSRPGGPVIWNGDAAFIRWNPLGPEATLCLLLITNDSRVTSLPDPGPDDGDGDGIEDITELLLPFDLKLVDGSWQVVVDDDLRDLVTDDIFQTLNVSVLELDTNLFARTAGNWNRDAGNNLLAMDFGIAPAVSGVKNTQAIFQTCPQSNPSFGNCASNKGEGSTATTGGIITRNVPVTITLPVPSITGPSGSGPFPANVTVTGTTVDPSTNVRLYTNGTPVAGGETTSSASTPGAWSMNVTLPHGTNNLTARVFDAGGVSDPSNVKTITIDAVAPNAPVFTTPGAGATVPTGSLEISGTAEPNSTVKVYEGLTSLGTTTASGGGAWSVPSTFNVKGSHTISATATDGVGNLSLASNQTFNVTTPSPVITVPAEGAFLNNPNVTFVGTSEVGSTVELSMFGVPFASVLAADGTWAVGPFPFSETTHAVTAVATGADSFVSLPIVRTFTVDLTAPAAPVITAPIDGATVSTAAVPVAGTAEPFATVQIFEDATQIGSATTSASGLWSINIPLANGAHTIVARAVDRAGNQSPFGNSVSFNVAALLVTITDPAQNSFQPGSVTVKGTAEAGATFVLVYDGGVQVAKAPVADGKWSKTITLASGLHTLTARGTNGTIDGPLSNSRAFTVDAAAPRLTIVKPSGYLLFQFMLLAPDIRALAEEIHSFDSGIASFELTYEPIFADGETMVRAGSCTGCGSKDAAVVDTPPLGIGLWEVTVKVTDKVGNVSTDTATLLSLGF